MIYPLSFGCRSGKQIASDYDIDAQTIIFDSLSNSTSRSHNVMFSPLMCFVRL